MIMEKAASYSLRIRQHFSAKRNLKPIRYRFEWLGWRAVAALKLTQRLHVDFTNHTIVGHAALDSKQVTLPTFFERGAYPADLPPSIGPMGF
ncbi:hypothetical protein [Burkholderia cenocepacia]|uniref:hypothetical protein n=1 Tax=Burkholderia cenocepacia TaxID=95486 RepID=UPI0015C54F45|nr:hypothetical protein [Burkholderia cenocepacia]